jgi:c-di-GMP-binding flagellar brake protein YcgR
LRFDVPDFFQGSPETQSGRVHRRRLLNIPAEVVLSSSQSFAVRLVDISEGGAGIVAPAAAPSGLRFAMRFQLPQRVGFSAASFELQSRVVHSILSRDSAGFKIGVQFVGLQPSDVDVLRNYVAS